MPSFSRQMIVEEYERIRVQGQTEHSIAYTIAVRLGYAIDQNRSNAFVLKVLREHRKACLAQSS